MGTAIIGLILKVVVGCILAVLGLYLTALVVGERQTLRKTSTEHNTLLGKSIRGSLFLLVLLIAVVIALSCYVSLWFFLILIPSVFLGFALLLPQMSKSAAKKSLGSKSEREYEAARARLINKKSYACMKCGKKILSADKAVKLQGKTYCRNCALNVNAQIDEQQWIVSEKDKPPKQVTVDNERPKKEELPQANLYKKGDFIGQIHEVYDVLGVGGFGIVYLVYYNKQTAYAFKTFKDEYLEDNRVREQFRKEAALWINIGKHPHIVRAHYIGNFVDRLFIAMEYIMPNDKGINSLDGYLKYQPPDLAQSLRWAIQFCYGVEYAYSKGIKAHRDIKPANIMITQDKILKISDFGLAGVIGESKAISGLKLGIQNGNIGFSCQTMEGVGFGTPTHMPPEQFENAAGCDERSDIYSFGVVLYQMATGGKLPFLAPLPQNGSYEESRRFWVEMHKLHRLSLVPKLQSPLFSILQKCLEKDIARRYQSFNEMRVDLAGLLKEHSNEVISPPKIEELDVDELLKKGLSFIAMLKWREAIECYNKAIEIDPLNKRAWRNKGWALQSLEKWREAIECYDKALELDPFMDRAWNNKGDTLQELGNLEGALYCYDKVIKNDPMNIDGYVKKGDVLKKLNRHTEAADCYKKTFGIIPRDVWEWKAKGDAYERLELFHDAIECYDRALEIDSKDKWAWIGKANAFKRLRKWQEALSCYDKALELDPAGTGGTWSSKGLLHEKLGDSHKALESYEKALKYDPTDDIAEEAIQKLRSKLL